jgi:hypothetical protein
MKQKSTSMIAFLSVVVLGLLTGVTGQILGQSGRLVSKFGQAQVEGRDVIVHVTVVVPPGANANQAALDALRDQGARPFQGDEFSTTGLVWDQFTNPNISYPTVEQYYNGTGDPTTGGGGGTALWNTHLTWTGVSTSEFAFEDGGVTDRCPSLVKECKGPQTFDGFNDVAWMGIRGCCTLAVTWYGTSIDEADMGINTNFSWSTDGSNGYDVESVILHENGHVVGLGHSEVGEAVMYAYYVELRRSLDSDDIDGVSSLYPANGTTGSISGMVTSSSDSSPISGATVEVETKSLWTTTDNNGDYSIDRVPTGTYDVTASASGFFSDTVSADTDTSGVNFTLEPDGTSEEDTTALEIWNVASEKSGKGGNFKITWDTNIPADSDVTFTCCGTFTNSELVTGHSMSFRGQKNVTYEYWVSSTDADGSTVTSGPHEHLN